jgi:hypothetical protein
MSTPNMGLTLPTDGGSFDIWDTILDTAFGLIDSHNHTTGQGVQVPTAALDINADLPFSSSGTNFSATQLLAAEFTPSATTLVAGYANALFANSSDNNLYWRNSSGTNVQMTSGSSLNVAGFVGGIGGDYSSVSALLSYVDADKDYLLQQEGSPRPWAGIRTGDVQIYQKAASITSAVILQSPAGLAATYTLVLPTAAAAAVGYLRNDGSGNLSFAQSYTLLVPASAADAGSNTRVADSNGTYAWELSGGTGSGGIVSFPVPLPVGAKITSVVVRVNKVSSTSSTIQAQLCVRNTATGAEASTTTNTLATNAPGYATITLAPTVTLTAGQAVLVGVGMSVGAATTDTVLSVEVVYVPA